MRSASRTDATVRSRPVAVFGRLGILCQRQGRMSAPDYNDPNSKLRLRPRLRPMRGSGSIFAIASGIGLLGMCLCVLAFLVSFWPGVAVSGDRFWALAFALGFGLEAVLFNWLRKLVRRIQ